MRGGGGQEGGQAIGPRGARQRDEELPRLDCLAAPPIGLDVIFTEAQKFHPTALWLSRAMLAGMISLAFYLYAQNSLTLLEAVILVVTLAPISVLLEISTLTVEISTDSIKMNYFPFSRKKFLWADVKAASVVDYGFVGGWGLRLGTKYGAVYNSRGTHGLFLTLNSGQKCVIGTQQPDALRAALLAHGKITS